MPGGNRSRHMFCAVIKICQHIFKICRHKRHKRHKHHKRQKRYNWYIRHKWHRFPMRIIRSNSTSETNSTNGTNNIQLDWTSKTSRRIINLPTNQKCYDNSKTTVGKLSARRIQIFPDYFCLGIIFKVILNNFQNNA